MFGYTLKIVLLSFVFSTSAWSFSNFKVGTFNIRNFSSALTKKKSGRDQEPHTNLILLKKLITQSSADVLAIQEIKNPTFFRQYIKKQFNQYGVLLSECGGRGEQRLGFIYNTNRVQLIKSSEDQRVNIGGDCENGVRPAMLGFFKDLKSDKSFVAISLHLKAGGNRRSIERRKQQHKVIHNMLKELRKSGHKNIMLMGDLNTTSYLSGNDIYEDFKDFVRESGLQDFSEEIRCSSYWSGQDRNDGRHERSLLDHVMISNELANQINYSDVEVLSHCRKLACGETVPTTQLGKTYEEVSDHCPVIGTLK